MKRSSVIGILGRAAGASLDPESASRSDGVTFFCSGAAVAIFCRIGCSFWKAASSLALEENVCSGISGGGAVVTSLRGGDDRGARDVLAAGDSVSAGCDAI